MNATPAHWNRLDGRGMEIAWTATKARMDTIDGGASALVWAQARGDDELGSVVRDVYSASTGKHSAEHEAWECGECGSAWLGRAAAKTCCSSQDEPFEVPEFEEEP